MRIELGQMLQKASGQKAKTKSETLAQSLKEGDKLDARVLSGAKNSVTLKTEDGQIVKVKMDSGVTLAAGDEVTLEVTSTEDGVIYLSVSEKEQDGESTAQTVLTAARGFEDKSLEPYAQKLLELKMPVREETARAMRGLMEAHPDMKPEEAAFLASNGITQDSGLIKAALALLSGEAKTDELVGLMLKLLGDVPEDGAGQTAAQGSTNSEMPSEDMPHNTALKQEPDTPRGKIPVMPSFDDLRGMTPASYKNAGSREVPREMPRTEAFIIPKADAPQNARVVQSSGTPQSGINEVPQSGMLQDRTAGLQTGVPQSDAAVPVPVAQDAVTVNPGALNGQTTLTGWINAIVEQSFGETGVNPGLQISGEYQMQEPVVTGDTTGDANVKTPDNSHTNVTPQTNETSADNGFGSQNNPLKAIIPQSPAKLQNEFSTLSNINQKKLHQIPIQGEKEQPQDAKNTEYRRELPAEPMRNDFRQADFSQAVRIAMTRAAPITHEPMLQQTAQKAPEMVAPQGAQTVQKAPETAVPQGEQTAQKAPETAVPRGEQTAQKAPETVVPQGAQTVQKTPETVAPQGAQAVQKTPETATPQGAQTVQKTLETATPQGAQTVQKAPETAVPQSEQTVQKTPETGVPQGAQAAQKAPETAVPQGAQTVQKTPETAVPQSVQKELEPGRQKILPESKPAPVEERVSETLTKILAEMPEFEGTPERALTRFSQMLLSAARDGADQSGDLSEKLSAMLEKMFLRLEKDDKRAGERLRQAKDELFMRLSMVEETVSGTGHPAKTELLRQTQKLMDHVRLINSIEQFVYMQLPVNIGGENRTADLYVYKRKRGSKSIDPENVNILLSLDLENMGHWESFVNIKGKEVSLRMEVSGEKEKEYFSENTVKLHNLLAEAGFKLSGTSIAYSKGETTPMTALAALDRYRTGRVGALDFTI